MLIKKKGTHGSSCNFLCKVYGRRIHMNRFSGRIDGGGGGGGGSVVTNRVLRGDKRKLTANEAGSLEYY